MLRKLSFVVLAAMAFALLPLQSAGQSTINRVVGPSTLDIAGSANVNTEGQKYSYVAGIASATPAATPTDIAVLSGSATKTIRVTRVTVAVQATTGGIVDFRLVTRSGGTQSAVNTAFANGTHSAALDSTNPASTVIAAGLAGIYTANPASTGTTLGVPVAWTVNAATPATGGPTVLEYVCNRPSQCIVLRGVGQFLAVNGNGHTLAAGEKVGISYEWTEE